MAEVANPTELREWFDSLLERDQGRWLDAWEDDGDVPPDLLETLLGDRRPRTPGQAVALTSWSWWVAPGNQPEPNYRMTVELRAFLGEEHRKRHHGQ